MKFALSTTVLLLMGSTALASVQVNNCWGNSGGCKQGGGQTTKVKGGRRSLQELFRRDPDFEFAMGILGMPSLDRPARCIFAYMKPFHSSKCKQRRKDRRPDRRRYQKRNC